MTIEEAARSLILGDPSRLLPRRGASPGSAIGGAIEVTGITVHPVIARRGDRVHRPITVRYSVAGSAGTVELWLKARPGIAVLFPTLEACSQRLGDEIFPRPLYAWTSDTGGESFLITERVGGEPLRDRLVKAALVGRTAELAPIFRANGAKMRAFHDAFEPSGAVPAVSIVAGAQALVAATDYLGTAEKASIEAHLEGHARSLAAAGELPLRRLHGDWILRNIVVDRAGRDRIVDCDSMRGADQVRWYDVAYLQINLESQTKWSPLLTRRRVAPLWQAFWNGYRGSDGGGAAATAIDGLANEQIPALLYAIRVQYLLGGTTRVPLYRMFGGMLGRRYLRALVRGLVAGDDAIS